MKCLRTIRCADCPSRGTCPASMRRDKRARRPMSGSASMPLVRKAATILSGGWYTCRGLAEALYGKPKGGGKSDLMSIMVRARRPINRMKRMGVLAIRPDSRGKAEYTLLPEGREVLSC